MIKRRRRATLPLLKASLQAMHSKMFFHCLLISYQRIKNHSRKKILFAQIL